MFTDTIVDGKKRCICSICGIFLCIDIDTLRNHVTQKHPESVTTPPSNRKRRRTSSDVPVPIPVWSAADNNEANTLLAEFIYEAALPFSITAHPAFLKWVSKLNNLYTPASRTAISDTYLDNVYNNTKAQVESRLKDQVVVLGVDQSTDGAGEPIAHITVVPTGGSEYIWDEIPHFTEEHSAENLMTHIVTTVEDISKLNVTVHGIINDNEPKSGCVREKFQERYSTNGKVVFTPGDAPHALQCVFKDTIEKIPTFKNTNDNCIILADKFKNTRLRMFLKDELDINDGRLSTNMPVITRWGTHLKTYQTVAKFKSVFIVSQT